MNKIKISDNFLLSEFESSDTGEVKIDEDLVNILEKLREIVSEKLGKETPLIINSGYRTWEHNKKVGGARDSQHLYGRAADVRLPKGITIDEFAQLGERVGFDGIGKYKGRVHFDVRGYKARWDNR